MKLAIISSQFPFNNHEPYLGAELAALKPYFESVTVFPVRTRGGIVPTIVRALQAYFRSSQAAGAALRDIIREPKTFACKVKNCIVFPRALALSERMHRLGIGHVHSYWLSTPATVAYVVARMNGIPWSSTAHRWDIFEDNMLEAKARSAEFIRAISERGKREILRRTSGANNVYVIRLGTALCVPRDEVAATVLLRDALSEGRRFRFLCAAAFVPVKGHAALIEAFASARNWNPELRLTLAGTGPLEPQLRELVRQRLLGNAVDFRGYIPHAQLIEEMRSGAYHAVVLASRDNGAGEMEGIPSILIEAMSVGIPCVATASGSVPELLDNATGYLVHSRNQADLAEALLKVSLDPQERNRCVKRAFTRVRALHNPRQFATRLYSLITNSLEEEVLVS